jgi:hypothetical protein
MPLPRVGVAFPGMFARQLIVMVALVAADLWCVTTLVNAITGGKGHGSVFWTAIALIAAVTVGLIWWTIRVARRFVQPP